ncbi:C-X-C chemokine receptor type 5 isoform X1 [Oncorhynchus keta]|uniref:C-X-C chemokine receptor type 5 isoform X1 n=3 Tax=Oncorhynchus TaxID=8016 RepID=UPI00227A0998|nr:C-X-C chemokine receptor type 5 isoform X1 [Oncorhynchus keta]
MDIDRISGLQAVRCKVKGSFEDGGLFYGFDNYSELLESPDNSSSDTEYTCNDGAGLQLFHTVFQPLVYSLVFFLGLTGNGLMLTVLLKRRGLLRITEIYLLHLGLADLMLLATFPFALAQVSLGVVFGDVLCKLIGLMNRLNFLCGSLLLACIGFDRYLAIVHAITSLQSRRPRNVHLTCLALWLVCLALSAPNAVFLSVGESPIDPTQLSCFFHSHGLHANNWDLTERLLTHVLCFFLPLGVMTYCYTAVAVTLHHSQRGQRSLEKEGAIRLAALVTAVFCLCWLPYNITMLVKTLVDRGLDSGLSCQSRTSLDKALVVTESLGYTHCCLNPLLYAFTGVRFRQDLLRLLAH